MVHRRAADHRFRPMLFDPGTDLGGFIAAAERQIWNLIKRVRGLRLAESVSGDALALGGAVLAFPGDHSYPGKSTIRQFVPTAGDIGEVVDADVGHHDVKRRRLE